MIRGVAAQLELDDLLKDGCCGVQVPDDDAAEARSLAGPGQGFDGKYKDDLGGQVLKDELVVAARAKEVLHFHLRVCG